MVRIFWSTYSGDTDFKDVVSELIEEILAYLLTESFRRKSSCMSALMKKLTDV